MAMDVLATGAGAARLRRVERLRTLGTNVLFVLAVLLIGYSLIVTYQEKRRETILKQQEVERMRHDLARVVAQNDDLRGQIRFLQTEEGVEKVARERLGLIRPNETTYIVINAPRITEPAPRPSPAMGPSPSHGGVLRWLLDLWNGGE